MRCRITHTGKNHSACFSAWRRAPFVADDRSNLYAEKKQLEMLTYRNEDKRGTRRAGLPIAQLLQLDMGQEQSGGASQKFCIVEDYK